MNLTIEQRDRLRAILPQYPQKPVGRKRADLIKVFEGIVWVLESGARAGKTSTKTASPRTRRAIATSRDGSEAACS